MTKLNVGDRVRVIKEGDYNPIFGCKSHNALVGEEGTILYFWVEGHPVVDFGRHFPENGETYQAVRSHHIVKLEGK